MDKIDEIPCFTTIYLSQLSMHCDRIRFVTGAHYLFSYLFRYYYIFRQLSLNVMGVGNEQIPIQRDRLVHR